MVPGVALGGRFWAAREMNFLAALLALAIYVLALRLAPSVSAATLTWALFAFTSPLVVYSSQIYPEVPAALLSILAVLSFEKYRGEGRRIYLWLTGGILAALPWLNIRYWFVVVAIALFALFSVLTSAQRRAMDVVSLILPLVLGTVIYAIVDLKLYGLPVPNAGYFMFTSGQPELRPLSDPVLAFLGLFFDRARGLIPNSPVYLIVFAGLAVSLRRRKGPRWLLLTAALAGIVPATNHFWGGGWAPPSRYMLVSGALTIPLAAPALLNRWVRLAALPLTVWSLFVAGAYFAFPFLRYTAADSRSGQLGPSLQQLCGINPLRIFPALVPPHLIDYFLAGFWCLLIAGVVLLFILSSPLSSEDQGIGINAPRAGESCP
jgi:hypothetical protein